jgi:16S rRNA (guanine527-N7)-methyltransferase
MPGAGTDGLRAVLESARARGFLGPGPVEAHVGHASPLVPVLPPGGPIVDLGAGGGVPSLVLALARAETRWVLVEAQRRRADWLVDAIGQLGLEARAEVRNERAELTGRGPLRGQAVAVVARGFGPPAVTAECAAPLLRSGATCWVSEPPGAPPRWPEEGLALLGLQAGQRVEGWVGLDAVSPCPDRYPRRVGIPAKRPLF